MRAIRPAARLRWPAAAAFGLLCLATAGAVPVRPAGATVGPFRSVAAAATVPSPWAVIAIDPGHGGFEPGSVHRAANGRVDLIEKDVNLAIALRLAAILSDRGYQPVLTRWTDSQVNTTGRDLNRDGRVDTDDDLQARVDIANESGAALLFSIHNNGLSNPLIRGTSAWSCIKAASGAESRRLARSLQGAVLARLREAGYANPIDGGANDDAGLGKPYGHLFIGGPKTPRVARPLDMPAVTGETLYLTNDREAALLQDESILDAIALAYADAVDEFLSGILLPRGPGPRPDRIINHPGEE